MPLDDALLAQLPDTFTVEHEGRQMPLRETSFVREAKDFQAFARSAYDAHREVGARIPIKGDSDTWRKEHLPKLYKAGILTAPPATPEEYGITKPSDAPDGLMWDEDRARRYATVLHKHGVPKAIVPELMALHVEALQGQNASLKTSHDAGMVALKKEFGDKFDVRREGAKRLISAIFKTPEEVNFFEQTGVGDHPTFLSVLMRLAPLAEQDSSVLAGLIPSAGAGGTTGDEVRKEVADIMSNPNNARNKLYWQRDKATLEYIDNLYKKAYGTGQTVLT